MREGDDASSSGDIQNSNDSNVRLGSSGDLLSNSSESDEGKQEDEQQSADSNVGIMSMESLRSSRGSTND